MPTGIYIRTQEHKQRISDAKKGISPLNLEWLHEHVKGQKRPTVLGANNVNWKGDDVSYRNLHRWVERQKGKANHCENNPFHISTRYHWANISKEYKRDLTDWMQLCPSCNLKDRTDRRVAP